MAKSRYPFECSAVGLLQQAELVARNFDVHITTEFKFHPTRNWRFDIAIVEPKLALEYNGLFAFKVGDSGKSGHQTVRGMRNDWEKIREAQLAGWMILPFGPDETRTGEAMNVILRAMELRK